MINSISGLNTTYLQPQKKIQDKDLTAKSGKDKLGITKGNGNNSYVIHFSDSAKVSRAVSRGCITINGVDIELSEETKRKLSETDEQAEQAREKAYSEYVMQHELAVARQQAEAWNKALKELSEEMEILLKMLGKVDETAEQNKEKNLLCDNVSNTHEGVSWSQFEFKTYDTHMNVEFTDTAQISDISIGEHIV